MRVACDCDDWKIAQHEIDSAVMLAHLHGSKFTFKVFRYCPYCGKELIKEE